MNRAPVALVIPSNIILASVTELDSHRAEILLCFSTMQKKNDQVLRAPSSVGVRTIRPEPTREKKNRDKRNDGTYYGGERGGGAPQCDPASEFLLGGKRKSRARVINGIKKTLK